MKRYESADPWVEQFMREALPKIKEFLNPQLVVIFGSRLKGEGTEESDIDVIVVSDFFREKPFLGRMPMMLRMLHFPLSVDFLCYTPEEFKKIKTDSIIVQEALREGLEVPL